MSTDTHSPQAAHPGAGVAAAAKSSWAQRLRRLKDRAEVARVDGVRGVRDRTAIAASTGRAQMERVQSFVSFQAQRRPLVVIGLAAAAGAIAGLALRARAASRAR